MLFSLFFLCFCSYLKANQTTAPASQDSFGILCSMTASVDDMLSDLRELQMSLTLEAQVIPQNFYSITLGKIPFISRSRYQGVFIHAYWEEDGA